MCGYASGTGMPALFTFREFVLSRLMKSNYSNTAQLKELMTAPPMTAEQHAAIMRKRISHRRMVEEAREMKQARCTPFDK
jgi:ketol-acid reductoisomerase